MLIQKYIPNLVYCQFYQEFHTAAGNTHEAVLFPRMGCGGCWLDERQKTFVYIRSLVKLDESLVLFFT